MLPFRNGILVGELACNLHGMNLLLDRILRVVGEYELVELLECHVRVVGDQR